MGLNYQTSEDIVQASFTNAWKALGKFKDRGYGLKPWLYKIAANTAISHLRKGQISETPIDIDSARGIVDNHSMGLSAEAIFIDRTLSAPLEQAIGTLPENFKIVLGLIVLEGLSYREVAELTGMPINTVRTRMHRARKTLRGILEQDENPETDLD